MMNPRFATLLGLVAAGGATATAQVFGDFESFTSGATSVMFRQPSFSGSTGGFLNTTPNVTEVTDAFPAGNARAGSLALHVGLDIKVDAVNPWVRLTTFGATSLPNPTIDFTQYLQFDVYSDRAIKLALGVRETGTSADIGANGGTSGSIEFVGTDGKIGSGPNPLRTIAAGTWTTVAFNVDSELAAGFTGNGIVDLGATGKGVLEHLGLVPLTGETGTFHLYFDNFEVTATPVPEPTTYALIAGLGLMGFAASRRAKR